MAEDAGREVGPKKTTTPKAEVVEAAAAAGFSESTAFSGLTFPTAVRFADDGRVFVAEKSGLIKVFDSMSDPTPTTFADLRTKVDDYWDRGLLGIELAPDFPSDPFVYVLYTYDAPIGGTAPVWNDACPTPPGPTTNGCVVSGRLSRLQASGNQMTGSEQVLVNDWCQQFPSHSVGDLRFGPDGALYVSAGDGASFTFADVGQAGNPCGDPAGEGGSLRAQDLRTMPTGGGGAAYPTVVAADSPIAYWRLGETTGVVAADLVGGNNGWYGGGTRGVPGAIVGDANGAVSLNGTADYVGVGDYAALDLADGPFSVELWVKRNSTAATTQALIDRGPGSYQITISGSTGKFTVARNGGSVIARESGTTTDTAWHHFVVTKSGATTRIYKDGIEVTSDAVTVALTNTSTNLWFGRWNDGTRYGNVQLDEVAIYGTVLSASRVAAHRQAGIGGGGGGASDPVTLDGAILRLDPATGAALPTNPGAGQSDPNARRIIAHGFRNPFRLTFRPGTGELWFGDVGLSQWEEIGRIASPTAAVRNFGWPCYEGVGQQSGHASSAICQSLYGEGTGAVVAPYHTYRHSASVVAGDGCPTGSSSISGLAFYDGTNYPAEYRGALFFSDYSRDCLWAMMPGANGLPSPSNIRVMSSPASNPVAVEAGPNGDIFYVDFDGGRIRRITSTAPPNGAPTAVATATPSSGPAPLAVSFSGSGSSDPEGGTLTYAWDLDGDGAYDDATGVSASRTYTAAGTVVVGLRVTDPGGQFDTDTVSVTVANSQPPVPTISTPTASVTWAVGQTIDFSGSATDPDTGPVAASGLSWSLVMHHCPSNCHTHQIQTFDGVASGSFAAPDHEYPSHLELILTATDPSGVQASTSVLLQPRTVDLTFATAPTGLKVLVNAEELTGPTTRRFIVGSQISVASVSPQTSGGTTYTFDSWSDGGASSHQVTAPTSAATLTATYEAGGPPAASYHDTVVGDTPFAYWRLADTSGIIAADEVGTRTGWYGGTVTKGVAGALAGDSDAAVRLDGTSGYVGIPGSNAPSMGNGPFSVEFWVKRSSATGLHPIFDRGPGGVQIQFSSTNNKLTVAQNGTGNIVAETTTTTDTTTWHHFVFTKDGSSVHLYRDGVEVTGTVTNRTLTNPSSNLWLGRWNDGTRFGAISLDEVAVYTRVLSAGEVAEHYAAGTGA